MKTFPSFDPSINVSAIQNTLLIFSRYPEPGSTKTRLIPALGDLGAATLHRKMAEQVVETARSLRKTLPLKICICFTGSEKEPMQAWLGADLDYLPQGSGDLGQRLDRALERSFAAEQPPAVVVIGTDCPLITPDLLGRALAGLQTVDLVLGPAEDGGYYLMGLRRAIPELFQGIAWGSDRVFADTLGIAEDLGLTQHILEPLPDIDRPEDLRALPESLQAIAQPFLVPGFENVV